MDEVCELRDYHRDYARRGADAGKDFTLQRSWAEPVATDDELLDEVLVPVRVVSSIPSCGHASYSALVSGSSIESPTVRDTIARADPIL